MVVWLTVEWLMCVVSPGTGERFVARRSKAKSGNRKHTNHFAVQCSEFSPVSFPKYIIFPLNLKQKTNIINNLVTKNIKTPLKETLESDINLNFNSRIGIMHEKPTAK